MADTSPICIPQNAIYSRKQAQKMALKTRALWSEARDALEQVQHLRSGLNTQIQELAKTDSFRRQYMSNMLTGILSAVMEGTRADMGNIQLYNPAESRLIIYVQLGFEQPFLEFFDVVHSGQAACGMALQASHRVAVSDVTDSPVFRSAEVLEVLLDAGVRSVQSTPIVGESGVVLGMLSTHYRAIGHLAARDLQLVDRFASRAAAVIEWHNRHTLCHGEASEAATPRDQGISA